MEGGVRRQLALYFSAQQFLTRLPTPGWIGHEPDRLARASRYFPAVGIVLGLIAGGFWWAGASILPPLAAAALALGVLLLLTGALHEDGLADCADGLGGGRTTERSLEIMRDSAIGVFGAAALILTLALRVGALAALTPTEGFAALIVALAAGRAGMTLILATGDYARSDGAARETANGVDLAEAAVAAAIALAAGLAFGGFVGAFAVFMALSFNWFWGRYLRDRLGGYTGDGLGAGEQIGHISALIVFAGAWT